MRTRSCDEGFSVVAAVEWVANCYSFLFLCDDDDGGGGGRGGGGLHSAQLVRPAWRRQLGRFHGTQTKLIVFHILITSTEMFRFFVQNLAELSARGGGLAWPWWSLALSVPPSSIVCKIIIIYMWGSFSLLW